MKLFRPWVMASVVALAACGDGLKSPDFTSVVTLESVEVVPVNPAQGTEIPAGSSLSFRAIAILSSTVPPGSTDTSGAPIDSQTTEEDVTALANWTSSSPTNAEVDAGVVSGKVASSTPVTITASYEDLSDTTQVTITDAELNSVDHVKPAGVARSATDTYGIVAGASANFEIYGRFSDDVVRQLNTTDFVVDWSSSNPTVANNPDGDQRFDGLVVGSAQVTGQVTNVSASPDSATATLNVGQLNEFCEAEFVAPPAVVATAASAACVGCSVDNEAALADGDIETAATMNIPLGLLLQSSVSASVHDTTAQRLVIGRSVGFVVSRPMDLLVAQLLSELSIDTLQCDEVGTCAVVESFSVGDPAGPLYLSLLGLIGGQDSALVSTPPLSADANGVRLNFSGGLLSALATLDVKSACAVAANPPAAAP